MLTLVIFKEIRQIGQTKYYDWDVGCRTPHRQTHEVDDVASVYCVSLLASLLWCPFPSFRLADGAARFVIVSIEHRRWSTGLILPPCLYRSSKWRSYYWANPLAGSDRSSAHLPSANFFYFKKPNFLGTFELNISLMDQQWGILFSEWTWIGRKRENRGSRPFHAFIHAEWKSRWWRNRSFSFPSVCFLSLMKFASANQVAIASDRK